MPNASRPIRRWRRRRGGPAGRKRIADAAATTATALDVDEQTAIEEAQQEFEQLVARQLVAADEHEPEATTVASSVPELQLRLDAASQRHQEKAAEEIARTERERAEADAVIANEQAAPHRNADAEATAAERAAASARRQAETLRARKLADAVARRGGRQIRLSSGRSPYSTETLVAALRRGEIGANGMAAIERALKGAAA